ncbi:hypothetical protein [Cupriavidus basilensis]
MQLDFISVNEPTMQFDFVVNVYRAWVDDPTWPYGIVGVFKGRHNYAGEQEFQ